MTERTHEVIDTHTGAPVGRYCSSRSAHRVADRLDLKYGAARYAVRLIPWRDDISITEHTAPIDRLAFANEWQRLTGSLPAGVLPL